MGAYGKRLEQLRELLKAERLEAMVVTQPENRRYLSGYTGADGTLFVSPERAVLITDFRFTEQASREAPRYEVVEALPEALPTEFARLARETGAERVAFESHHVPFATGEKWAQAAEGYLWEPRQGLVEGLRSVKDEHELELIRKAAAIGDAAMNHVRGFIRPGMTEREVAWEIEVYVRTHGAEAVGFEIIVASGPNGAMGHAAVSDRVIQEGEPVVIDVGARVEGYCSDLTRTLILGQPDQQFNELYYLVLDAQTMALAGIKPSLTGREADALARGVIESGGYGHLFGHGLGHSVGLAIHEDPRMGKRSPAVLRVGNILTVEPGIYITGWGGVRIEDLVVVTEGGVDVLSRAAKAPLLLP